MGIWRQSGAMLIRFAAFALALMPVTALAQEASLPAPEPRVIHVELQTTMGNILVALEVERAPITAGNFLRYVEEDRLDGTVFYRAMVLDWGMQPTA